MFQCGTFTLNGFCKVLHAQVKSKWWVNPLLECWSRGIFLTRYASDHEFNFQAGGRPRLWSSVGQPLRRRQSWTKMGYWSDTAGLSSLHTAKSSHDSISFWMFSPYHWCFHPHFPCHTSIILQVTRFLFGNIDSLWSNWNLCLHQSCSLFSPLNQGCMQN